MNYQITYLDSGLNPRTISLLPGDDGVRIEWKTELDRNITSTGIYETIVQNTLRFVTFDCYFTESTFHKIESWLMYAQQGHPFAFTKDSSKSAIWSLSTGATVGSTTLSVDTDPTALSTGDFIIVRDSFGTKWNVLEVSTTTTSPDVITLAEPLVAAFSEDDLVNWYYTFDSLYLLDDSFDPDKAGEFWHHKFECVEVRNAS
jgi:hypothetical protein